MENAIIPANNGLERGGGGEGLHLQYDQDQGFFHSCKVIRNQTKGSFWLLLPQWGPFTEIILQELER